MATLEARGVSVRFEGLTALDRVDLEVRYGEILGLIGPNGAGKTTLVNVVTGFQRPGAGSVHFAGADVTPWPPHRIARAGLARTFQSVRLFPDLTVS
jgi:branched-chain amino acid transport system ATP-binding protein